MASEDSTAGGRAADSSDYSEARRSSVPTVFAMKRSGFEFVLHPSAPMGWMLAGLHAAALVPVWSMSPWPPAGAVLTLLIGLSLAGHLRAARAAWRIRLTATESGPARVRVEGADGRVREGMLHGSTLVSARLVILRIRAPGAWRCASIAISRAQAGGEIHRRLRVWLRWSAMPSPRRPAKAPDEPNPSGPVPLARR